jgi:hypothetical protein
LLFDLSAGAKRKVQIVNDEESSSDEDKKNKSKFDVDFELPDVNMDEIETPYQKLLNELKTNRKKVSLDFLEEKSEKAKGSKKAKTKNGKSSRKLDEEGDEEEDESEIDDSNDQSGEEDKSGEDDEQSGSSNDDDDDEDDGENIQVNTYAQEVLCKDSLDSEELYKNGSNFFFALYLGFI